MKFIRLAVANILSAKLSLVLTTVSISLAFFLFGILGAFKTAMNAGFEIGTDDRLVVMSNINFTQPLPLAYLEPFRQIDGVADVTHANWFGGYINDHYNRIHSMAVDHFSFFAVYDELRVSDTDWQAWNTAKTGALVGRQMAAIHQWKIGDRISLSSSIYHRREGGNLWDLDIVGFFDADDELIDTNYLLFRFDYFNFSHTYGENAVGWYVVKTDSGEQNETVAKALDQLYKNTPFETKTTTEKAFNKAFIEQIGDIGLIVNIIISASFFCIIMVVGNTMMQKIRSRYSEFAVLSVLGYSSGLVFVLIMLETLIQVGVAGSAGLFLAWLSVDNLNSIPEIRTILPNLVLSPAIFLEGIVYILLVAVLTGVIPAVSASRLDLTTVLNRDC